MLTLYNIAIVDIGGCRLRFLLRQVLAGSVGELVFGKSVIFSVIPLPFELRVSTYKPFLRRRRPRIVK
jgi:hypothetical protein